MKTSKKKHVNNYMEDPNLLIYNTDNYNQHFADSFEDILTILEKLMIEYTTLFVDKIRINTRNNWNYIFEKGFETIIHSFKIIYYYTKNLNLTYYNCQKSYYTYIEFIEQIHCSNISYLKLTTREAIICSYKQTIYNFNDEYRSKMGEPTNNEKNILNKIDAICSMYKNTIVYLIHSIELNELMDNTYMNNLYNKVCRMKDNITNKIDKEQYDSINLFITLLTSNHTLISEFLNLISEFLKNIQQKKYSNKIGFINNNILHWDNDIVEINNIFNC